MVEFLFTLHSSLFTLHSSLFTLHSSLILTALPAVARTDRLKETLTYRM